MAKELLATGRHPQDRSERMIVNNSQAMRMAEELSAHPLTPEAVLELHRVVTAGALDEPVHFWLAYDHPFVDGNGTCHRELARLPGTQDLGGP